MYTLNLELFTVAGLVEIYNYMVSIVNGGEYIADADGILKYQISIIVEKLDSRGYNTNYLVKVVKNE